MRLLDSPYLIVRISVFVLPLKIGGCFKLCIAQFRSNFVVRRIYKTCAGFQMLHRVTDPTFRRSNEQ
jgi:hypothetical protein